MSTIQLTLRLTPGQFVEIRTAMARSIREHESRAAEEFGCSVHDSRIVRDNAVHYMRSALDAMRECHEVRQTLSAWLSQGSGVSFHFEPDEARQLQETFGLQVRHIATKVAS